MPDWIALRVPTDGGSRSVRAPLDAVTTNALVLAARSVRRLPPRPFIDPRFSVYVVLLEYDQGQFGLYVGMTGLTPEERFLNHKAGDKASKDVRRFGLGLLPVIYRHLNPLDWEPARIAEVELSEALRRTGMRVIQG